jgi:translation initiation factor IF-2
MDEIYTFKVNMNNQSFDSRLVNQLSSNNLKRLQVEHLVFKHCLEAGFLSQNDKDKNTQSYQWYKSVLEANIQALSLLERIIVDSDMMGSLEEFEGELEAKAAAIIKDIAQRIMKADIVGTEISSDHGQGVPTLQLQ